MELNPDKSKVIHFSRRNLNVDYRVNVRVLRNVEEQRDLGVHVHRSLEVGGGAWVGLWAGWPSSTLKDSMTTIPPRPYRHNLMHLP